MWGWQNPMKDAEANRAYLATMFFCNKSSLFYLLTIQNQLCSPCTCKQQRKPPSIPHYPHTKKKNKAVYPPKAYNLSKPSETRRRILQRPITSPNWGTAYPRPILQNLSKASEGHRAVWAAAPSLAGATCLRHKCLWRPSKQPGGAKAFCGWRKWSL